MAGMEQLEGTLLTEGIGGTKGTRIRQGEGYAKLDTGGSEQGIRGGKGGIDPSAAIDLRNSNVNLQSRNIQPLETKPVIGDGKVSAAGIERAGNILEKAVFDYAEREATLKADKVVMAYDDAMRKAMFGTEDGELNGFASLKGDAAVESRKGFFDTVDQEFARSTEGVDSSVKMKAMSRLQSIRDVALNRASSHVVQQQQEAELQMRETKALRVVDDMVIGDQDFSELRKTFFSNFGIDVKAARENWDNAAITAGHRVYINAIRSNPAGSGMEALALYRAKVQDTVSPKALNMIDDYIKSNMNSEMSAMEHRKNIAEKELRKRQDEFTMKGSIMAEKSPGAFLTRGQIAAHFPEIDASGMEHILRVAKDTVDNKAGREENETAFHQDVMFPLQSAGEVIPDYSTFYNEAKKYGIKSEKAYSLFKQHSEPIKEDEKALKTYLSTTFKNLDSYFKVKTNAGASMAVAWQAIMGGEDASSALASVSKNDPPELNKIKTQLFSIARNKDLTPMQREQEMNKYLTEQQGTDAFKKEGFAMAQSYPSTYHVEHFKRRIEKAQSDGVVKSATAGPEPKEIAAAAITGMKPGAGAYKFFQAQVESNPRYSNLTFEQEEKDGKSVGVFKAFDKELGKVVKINLKRKE